MFNKFRPLLFAGIFVIALTIGLRSVAPGPRPAPDFETGKPGPEITIHIDTGMTGSEIGELLFKNGVVKSSLAYFRVAVSDSRSNAIAPGEHLIETRIPARTALKQLLDTDRIVNLIRIRDGARLIEVVEEMKRVGFSKSEIELALEETMVPEPFKSESLEGMLYPAFYSVAKDATAHGVIKQMLQRFQIEIRSLDLRTNEFLPDEILTIASLVEAEGTPDVFGKVARVIYNRLELGMKLQFDSTVHYVFERRGEIALSVSDTKVQNKYNTFVYAGLPPGPIGSPTNAAIKAALAPEAGDWLYFVTVLPGDTRFTSSYDEFLEFKAEYKRNYRNGAFDK